MRYPRVPTDFFWDDNGEHPAASSDCSRSIEAGRPSALSSFPSSIGGHVSPIAFHYTAGAIDWLLCRFSRKVGHLAFIPKQTTDERQRSDLENTQ